MTSAVWSKSFVENSTSSGATSFATVRLAEFLHEAATVRRVIVDWDLGLLNTSTNFPFPSQVPSAIGIGFSTAVPPADPLTPTGGPLSALGQYQWWWQGAVFRPIYVPATGNSWWGVGGRIDMQINHKLDPTLNTAIDLGIEVDDPPTSFFSAWSMVAYAQVLSYPTV